MPFDGNKWSDLKFVPYLIKIKIKQKKTLKYFKNIRYTEMVASIQKQFVSFRKCTVQDSANETAVKYEVPGFRYHCAIMLLMLTRTKGYSGIH